MEVPGPDSILLVGNGFVCCSGCNIGTVTLARQQPPPAVLDGTHDPGRARSVRCLRASTAGDG